MTVCARIPIPQIDTDTIKRDVGRKSAPATQDWKFLFLSACLRLLHQAAGGWDGQRECLLNFAYGKRTLNFLPHKFAHVAGDALAQIALKFFADQARDQRANVSGVKRCRGHPRP